MATKKDVTLTDDSGNKLYPRTYARNVYNDDGTTDLKTALDSKANVSDIPTKTSQLTNDSNFATTSDIPTNYVNTDSNQSISGIKTFNNDVAYRYTSTFYNANNNSTSSRCFGLYQWDDKFQYTYRNASNNTWLGTAFEVDGNNGVTDFKSKPTVNGSQVALSSDIPTKTSQLTNDSNFSTFSGNYNDLTNKPTIPTNYVTTNTEQTITAKKFFESGIETKSTCGKDTRWANSEPQAYMDPNRCAQEWNEFKSKSTIDTPKSDTDFVVLKTIAPWRDDSGGLPTQIAFGGTDISYRKATSNTTWDSWKTLATKNDVPTFTLDGTTLTITKE